MHAMIQRPLLLLSVIALGGLALVAGGCESEPGAGSVGGADTATDGIGGGGASDGGNGSAGGDSVDSPSDGTGVGGDGSGPDADQPTPDADQPTSDAVQPTPDADQPTPDADQPAPDADQPTSDADQPTAADAGPPAPDAVQPPEDVGDTGCVSGTVACDGDWVVVCGPDGETWTQIIECEGSAVCFEGMCCTPSCDGAACGDDGCGATCGDCADGTMCSEGACVCAPDCSGQDCGGDGCGGVCGECNEGDLCEDGLCVCVPSCGDAMCGDDGCGGSCGQCEGDAVCNAGVCQVVGACTNESDAAVIDSNDIPAIAQEAALGCLGTPDPALCVQEAVSQATGLSLECSACYGGLVSCIIANCLTACLSDAESEECLSCQEAVCLPDFDTCAFGDAVCSPACGGAECGDDGCGGSCGQCAPGETCGPNNLCGVGGQPNGAFCGITPQCQPNIPNPADPAEEIANPSYPACMSDQCESGFCLQDFAPGEVVFINTCSLHCTIMKDELNNRTGLPGPDGVEDEDTPWSDCTGFEGGGPAGSSYKCVSAGLPGQPATALCAPGTTFRECDADGDCPAGETCQITQLGGQMQERCMTATQSGEWGQASWPTGICNDDPFDGDVHLCTGGLCFIFGCVHFCAADTDCDTTQLGDDTGAACVEGACANWPGQSCETDVDCSAWSCLPNYNPFGDNLPSYAAGMCWPKGCQDITDCADNYYCRWWWNGEESEELGAWDHLCHGEYPGGAELGEECDSNPDDNIPGATCKAEDLCLGGRCSALCADDSQCATEGPAFQKCITEEVPFDPDDDGFYNYILPLEYCRAFEGFNGDCYSDTTCGEDESCTPYEVENWIEDPENPGEMIVHPDGGFILKGACVANDDSGGSIGHWGDECGVAGTNPCESFCLGADEETGTPGICTHLCESAADCPTVGEGETELQGRCQAGTNFRAGWGGTFNVLTDDLYYSLCVPTQPSSEQDCSGGAACPDGEACFGYQINFGPDYPATTEYICENILTAAGEGGTLEAGTACDPEAVDGAGDPMVDCAGAYCIADTLTVDEADQEYYCSQTCDPDNDTCAADGTPDMVCHAQISMPKAGAYESNQSMVYTCRKNKECTPCGINSDCVGDRVCVNMGSDDQDNAFYACVDACTADEDCSGTACSEGMDVL
ncbi:MAG: hypothetical protein QF464_00875, partial [Myxococcota bacterium]|nr:hypothetical protein [Myxococcota bacterium]